MLPHDLSQWQHEHRYETGGEAQAERRTRIVVLLTVVTMVGEIAAGSLFNSMALLADGWHMSTHAGALGIALFAYGFARRHADDASYSFGTGKVGPLAGFASAMVLLLVSVVMAWESAERLTRVQTIGFDQALLVAVLGLGVNLASAFILGGHGHHHDHGDHDHHHHHDHNLRAAYLHVVADAFTSVLAIVALLLGKHVGWWWMDPLMGFVGAAIIARWAIGLLRQTASVLLDHSHDDGLKAEVRAALEAEEGTHLTDLHLWQVGAGHWAAIVSVVTSGSGGPEHYKRLLAPVHELSHITVEIHRR